MFCPRDGTRLERVGKRTAALFDPLVGEVIDGRYRIATPLGEGAMSMVYAARHLVLEKPVALKVLRPEVLSDQSIGARFLREARALSQIDHRNVVRVSDFGRTPDGRPFMVMELLDGDTLQRTLRRAGRLPVERAIGIARQIAAAMDAAHRCEVVHRDLKPANVVLLRGPEGEDVVKVLDFGLARVGGGAANSITQAREILGTPPYLAPEQAQDAAVGPRADIYALAVMLYEMLAGAPPFAGDSALAIVSAQLHGDAPPLSPRLGDAVLAPGIEAAIVRGLARNPEERQATMREFAAELQGAREAPVPRPRPEVVDTSRDGAPSGSRIPVAAPEPEPAPEPGTTAAPPAPKAAPDEAPAAAGETPTPATPARPTPREIAVPSIEPEPTDAGRLLLWLGGFGGIAVIVGIALALSSSYSSAPRDSAPATPQAGAKPDAGAARARTAELEPSEGAEPPLVAPRATMERPMTPTPLPTADAGVRVGRLPARGSRPPRLVARRRPRVRPRPRPPAMVRTVSAASTELKDPFAGSK